MQSIGITRRLDEVGRIILPMELRRSMDISTGTGLEFFQDGDRIILRKYEPACIFCGEVRNAVYFRGKLICPACRKKLLKRVDLSPECPEGDKARE